MFFNKLIICYSLVRVTAASKIPTVTFCLLYSQYPEQTVSTRQDDEHGRDL